MPLKHLTPEQAHLVEDNHNLIYAYLRRHHLAIEEWYGVAATGMCRAAMGYRADGGASFSSYAYLWMRHEIGVELRRQNSSRRRCSAPIMHLETPLSPKSSVGDLISSIEDIADDTLTAIALQEYLRRLPQRTRAVLRLRAAGQSMTAIGRALGLSQSQVSRILCATRKELCEWLTC